MAESCTCRWLMGNGERSRRLPDPNCPVHKGS